MSFGGGAFRAPCDDDLRKLAIDELRAAGIAAVVASGNESYDGIISAPGLHLLGVHRRQHDQGGSDLALLQSRRHRRPAGTRRRDQIRSARHGLRGLRRHLDGGPACCGAFALLRDADPAASIDGSRWR
jgi:hypothetical protein